RLLPPSVRSCESVPTARPPRPHARTLIGPPRSTFPACVTSEPPDTAALAKLCTTSTATSTATQWPSTPGHRVERTAGTVAAKRTSANTAHGNGLGGGA